MDADTIEGFRPIDVPENASIRDRIRICCDAIKEGESFVLTHCVLEDAGYPDLVPKLDSIFSDIGAKEPLAIVYDQITGNFIVSRLKNGANLFDLIA